MRRKVTGQSSSTTTQGTPPSGISRAESLPIIYPYPQMLAIDQYVDVIKNMFCYVIKHYGSTGRSILIYRQPNNNQVVVQIADWDGNVLEYDNALDISKFLQSMLSKLVSLMKVLKIDKALFYFAGEGTDYRLVDVLTAQNKMSGPGMIRDIFSKILPTQEVIKVESLDERAIESMLAGCGSYEGDLIIKPSRFRTYHNAVDNTDRPLYVEVKR